MRPARAWLPSMKEASLASVSKTTMAMQKEPRPRPRTLALAVLLAAAAVQAVPAAAIQRPMSCIHPYPCGDEWPEGLQGPFEPGPIEYVRLPVPADYADPGAGTIELEGWVRRPILPVGVGAPVALHSTPYIYLDAAETGATPGDDAFWSDPPPSRIVHYWGVSPIALVRNGFAAAFFNVRGTGGSGGCYSSGGRDEQRDQAFLVDWLGSRPWSNGHVAMGGVSYPSSTAIAAAVQAPEALKTIIVSGVAPDPYTWVHTPQGAFLSGALVTYDLATTLTPPIGPNLSPEPASSYLEHVCEGTTGVVVDGSGIRGWQTDERNEDFFAERRLIDRFDDVEAAVLLAQGFQDDTGHAFQENLVWHALTVAPKRQIEGQWGHTFPHEDGSLSDASGRWDEVVFAWLDYWLKGLPRNGSERPIAKDLHLGTVDYEDSSGTWQRTSAWPPPEAREEVLYLGGESVGPEPRAGDRRYRSVPNPLSSYRGVGWLQQQLGEESPYRPWGALCGDAASNASSSTYVSEELHDQVLLAGNPFAYLNVESDGAGGIVAIALANLGPDFECSPEGQPSDVRWLTSGAADLRFHKGNFIARDFPTNDPTHIRIDLFDLAERIAAGHRLAVVVSYGETHYEWSGQPYFPEITVHADGVLSDSQLVVPVVEGSFGGKKPKLTYPPRPFIPVPSS